MRTRGGAIVGATQRSLMRRPIPSRGGQLEIAGVVVGSWGPNFGQPGRIPQPLQGVPQRRIPPQVGSNLYYILQTLVCIYLLLIQNYMLF